MKKVALLMAISFLFVAGCGGDSNQKKPTDNVKQNPIVEQKKVDVVPPGMYRVGKDILANEYIIVGQGMIYMQAAKDSTGAFERVSCVSPHFTINERKSNLFTSCTSLCYCVSVFISHSYNSKAKLTCQDIFSCFIKKI